MELSNNLVNIHKTKGNKSIREGDSEFYHSGCLDGVVLNAVYWEAPSVNRARYLCFMQEYIQKSISYVSLVLSLCGYRICTKLFLALLRSTALFTEDEPVLFCELGVVPGKRSSCVRIQTICWLIEENRQLLFHGSPSTHLGWHPTFLGKCCIKHSGSCFLRKKIYKAGPPLEQLVPSGLAHMEATKEVSGLPAAGTSHISWHWQSWHSKQSVAAGRPSLLTPVSIWPKVAFSEAVDTCHHITAIYFQAPLALVPHATQSLWPPQFLCKNCTVGSAGWHPFWTNSSKKHQV